MPSFRDGHNDYHRDNSPTSRPVPTAWRVTYLLQRPGWQRHKSPHAASLDAATKCLHVMDTSSSRLQERVDLTGEVEVAFVATAHGQDIIRFTVVAGHSSRKFALIAASGRDASELCQALDRQGVAVAGMENLPDAVFLRGSDQRTTQALEAGIPSLSRPEVQAYIVRLLFQDSFHRFVGDLSEMFSQVQTHLPVPNSAAAPTPRTPINAPAGPAACREDEDDGSGGSTVRDGAQTGGLQGSVAERGAGGAGRRAQRDRDRTAAGERGGGGGGEGGERPKGKAAAQASRGRGRGAGTGSRRVGTKGSTQVGAGAGTVPPTKRPRTEHQQRQRQRRREGGGDGGGASGSTIDSSPRAENVGGGGLGDGAEKENVARQRSRPVGERAAAEARASRRPAKAGGAGAVPDAAGAGRDRDGRGGTKQREDGNRDGSGKGKGKGSPRKRKSNATAAAIPPVAAVRAPSAAVAAAVRARAAAAAAVAAAASDDAGDSGAPLSVRPVSSSGRAPGLLTTLKKKWSQVNKHRSAWAFLRAVNLSEAPGYLDVVKRPLDLESIRKRLDGAVLHYTSSEMLRDDLCLMCRNAMAYNDEGTEFYRAAEDLLRFIESIFIVAG